MLARDGECPDDFDKHNTFRISQANYLAIAETPLFGFVLSIQCGCETSSADHGVRGHFSFQSPSAHLRYQSLMGTPCGPYALNAASLMESMGMRISCAQF